MLVFSITRLNSWLVGWLVGSKIDSKTRQIVMTNKSTTWRQRVSAVLFCWKINGGGFNTLIDKQLSLLILLTRFFDGFRNFHNVLFLHLDKCTRVRLKSYDLNWRILRPNHGMKKSPYVEIGIRVWFHIYLVFTTSIVVILDQLGVLFYCRRR